MPDTILDSSSKIALSSPPHAPPTLQFSQHSLAVLNEMQQHSVQHQLPNSHAAAPAQPSAHLLQQQQQQQHLHHHFLENRHAHAQVHQQIHHQEINPQAQVPIHQQIHGHSVTQQHHIQSQQPAVTPEFHWAALKAHPINYIINNFFAQADLISENNMHVTGSSAPDHPEKLSPLLRERDKKVDRDVFGYVKVPNFTDLEEISG